MLPYYEQTLGAYMATFVDAGKLPPEREMLLLLTQLCQALVHLQRNHVVHHDIKVCVHAVFVTALLLTHSPLPFSFRETTSSWVLMATPRWLTLARCVCVHVCVCSPSLAPRSLLNHSPAHPPPGSL